MKIVMNNDGSKPNNKGSSLLPLIPTELMALTKDNSIELLLATDPTHMVTSPKFKMQARILGGGEDARSALNWMRDAERIFHGLNITTGPDQNKMVLNLLTNTARTVFESHLTTLTTTRRQVAADVANTNTPGTGAGILNQHLDLHTEVVDITNAIRYMITQILPRRVCARVKRYLRRECRKPADMKVKIYLQHLLRINYSELQNLPPFALNQQLTQDELLDILLFGTPKSWQKEMERQGFDPMENDMNEVVTFMEQIESSEDYELKPNNNDKPYGKSSHKGKSNYSKVSHTNNQHGDKNCLYHGRGTHSSDECTVLKHLASQKKTKFEGNTSSNKYNSSSSGNW